MAIYKIVHKEELIGWFYVEADSEEEALEEFGFQVNDGRIDFSDMEMIKSSDEAVLDGDSGNKMTEWEIYEEGFVATGCDEKAHYLGTGFGKTFLDACKEYIQRTGHGEIRMGNDGKEYPCDWGCRWYPTLSEAQKSYG